MLSELRLGRQSVVEWGMTLFLRDVPFSKYKRRECGLRAQAQPNFPTHKAAYARLRETACAFHRSLIVVGCL